MTIWVQKNVNAHAMSPIASAYLDVLRVIGANVVIGGHVLLLFFGVHSPAGSFGVALFFLLSGFLITQSLLGAKKIGPRAPGFLADRTARIVTPYVPALAFIALVDIALITTIEGAGGNTGLLQFAGNLLFLQDHSIFQFLSLGGIDLPWRIKTYNSAGPFWTIAVELWLYVSVGLFFFCVLRRERIKWIYAAVLVAISAPVVIWNAAAGGGKSLSLIWLFGAIAGLLFNIWRAKGYDNNKAVGAILIVLGAVAMVGRVGKIGFDPYDLQTAALLALIMFGVLALLMRITSAPGWFVRPATFLASYSYSLYLIHNTMLIVVLDNMRVGADHLWLKIALAVLLAHLAAYALYVLFERHYRKVGAWLRPHFERALSPKTAVALPIVLDPAQNNLRPGAPTEEGRRGGVS